jgi:hypothetical protein
VTFGHLQKGNTEKTGKLKGGKKKGKKNSVSLEVRYRIYETAMDGRCQ